MQGLKAGCAGLRVSSVDHYQKSDGDRLGDIRADLASVDWSQVTATIDWKTILNALLPALLAGLGGVLPILIPALGPVIGPILAAILALFHLAPSPTPTPTPPNPFPIPIPGGGTIPVVPVP